MTPNIITQYQNINTTEICNNTLQIWLLAISECVHLLKHALGLLSSCSKIILLYFLFNITAKGSSFSQVPLVFGHISSQSSFTKLLRAEVKVSRSIFCFLGFYSSSTILLHFKDSSAAIFSCLLFVFSNLFSTSKTRIFSFYKMQVIWRNETMQFRICTYQCIIN